MTKGKKILAHAVLILASFLSVFPLYYMLCGATNPSIDVVRGKLIPGTYLMENFKSLIANQNLGLAMANSFRNAILMTFITLLVGLSEIGIFFRMFVPIMRSTYGAAMTVTFMNAWNSYLWPKIIFQNNASITMPMLVANLKSGYSVDYGMLMLGVLICTLPTAIIFLCLQKSFANGITGAVK